MQIIQPLRRTQRRLRSGHHQSFALLLLAPLALGLAWADPAPTPSPQTPSTTAPAKPASSGKKTAQAKTQAAAPAITTEPPPVVTKLPTIVVTSATRDTQPVDTTATTTTVLTHQELDDAKYASVTDALQSVPGMSVITLGMPGAQTSAFIHGLDSTQTLVTIDGRRQAVGFSGEDDNLANLTLDDIDQIEVVRTPTSSVQGGSAMGGVINLVTLSGKGLTTPEGSVSFEAGSFDTFRENAQSRGAVGNFDYALSISRQDSIYPALSPGDAAEFSPGFAGQAAQYRNTSYRGNFGYQVMPDIYVDLHTVYGNGYSSSPGEFPYPDPTASLLTEDWSLSPEIVAKVADFYTTKLYYTRDQEREVDNDPFLAAEYIGYGISPAGLQARTQINTDSIDWQNDFQIAHNWSVTSGIQGDSRNYYENDNNLGAGILSGHDDNLGGYISSQWQPLTGLNILTSGRYDSYSAFGGAFSWRQGVSYRIAPTQTLVHASVSSAYTPPSISQLYVSTPPYFSNPNLQPETDLGWEAGVEQPLLDDRVTPSVTYFHNNVKNEIGNVSLGGGDFMLENFSRVTTDGVEVGMKVKPCPTVSLNANYTYLNAVNDTTQTRLVRRPRNSVELAGTWNPVTPLTLTMGGNWVMGRQDFDAVTGIQEDAPDYFVLRASASYRINDTVSIWVRGENLTDSNYEAALGYYSPSIAGYGGIKISF